MTKTCVFWALCLFSVIALSYALLERAEPKRPQRVCPKGVKPGKSYPGPGCSLCKCNHSSISCKLCPPMIFMGMVQFVDESATYPICCPQFVEPEKVHLRKEAERTTQCREDEQLMCVKIKK